MNCIIPAFLVNPSLRPDVVRRSPGRGKRVLPVLGFLALLLALAVSGRGLRAQTFYGSISGVIKDPSGAVMPDVAVTVHENPTETEYKTVTNKAGAYRISFLKPGSYSVRFEKSGFAQYTTDVFDIVLNQDLIVDGALKVGAASEVVTVSGAASSLNDTNPQVGGEFNNQELIDLPEEIGTKGANEFLITKSFAGAASTSQDYSNVNNLSLGGGRPG